MTTVSVESTTITADLSVLAETANNANRAAEGLASEMLLHARTAGAALQVAEERLPDREYQRWCTSNLTFSLRTARVYRRIHANWDRLQPYLDSGETLSIRKAVALLSSPKVDRVGSGCALPQAGDDSDFDFDDDDASDLVQGESVDNESEDDVIPPPGMLRYGHYRDGVILVEAFDEYVRMARTIELRSPEDGELLDCDIQWTKRGIRRDHAEIAIAEWAIDLKSVEWNDPQPRSAESNLFLPLINDGSDYWSEWRYPPVEACEAV